MYFPVLVTLVCVLFSFLGTQATAERSSDPNSTCPINAPEWATDSENWAWSRICAGVKADMREAPGGEKDKGCNAHDLSVEWPKARTLSAEFVKVISTHKKYTSAMYAPGVEVSCAVITGELKLYYEDVAIGVWLDDSRFDKSLSFHGARFARELSFIGSNFGNNNLYFEGARISGPLDLTNISAASVGLQSAKAYFLRAVDAEIEALYAFNFETEGNFLLERGAFTKIRLGDARIGLNLALDEVYVSERIFANRLSVGAGIYASKADLVGGLYLRNAEVAENIHLDGALLGPIVLRGSQVGGRLALTGDGTELVWTDHAYIDLRNTKIGTLVARFPEDWLMKQDAQLDSNGTIVEEARIFQVKTDLTGLTYDNIYKAPFYGASNGDEASAARNPDGNITPKVADLIDWIQGPSLKSSDAHNEYNPQPYVQLASVLEASGNHEDAKLVEFKRAAHRVYTREFGINGIIGWVGDFFWFFLTLFGAYPFFPLVWFATLVSWGTVLAKRSVSPIIPSPFWYSVQNTLPLISASPEHQIIHENRRVARFFHAQKVLGFILATVLIAALSLVGG